MQGSPFFQAVGLSGLTAAPPQQFGQLSLVPLLRKDTPGDLRLPNLRQEERKKDGYTLFPHALIHAVKDERQGVRAVFGTQILPNEEDAPDTLRVSRLSVRRSPSLGKRPRFLPLDMALEGFLAFHFGGVPEAWGDYADLILSREVRPVQEWAQQTEQSSDIDDALRSFELHQDQSGLLLFIKEELAAAFVAPHPDDYRQLHPSLLEDLYRGLLGFYGRYTSTFTPPTFPEEKGILDLEGLRASFKRWKGQWATTHTQLFQGGLLSVDVSFSTPVTLGPFRYKRFGSQLLQTRENLIGELIQRDSGRLEYLKTYKLTRVETRRTYLIERLSNTDWEPRLAAASLGITVDEFCDRMKRAGFGYLLQTKVLNQIQKSARANRKGKKR